MLYNWAAENPDKVRSITGIYAVSDLRSYPRLQRAAEAYGTTVDELEKHLAEHNPIDRLEPLAKAGIPILHIHGDVDRLVPLDKNAQVIYDRYQKLGGKMELIVIPGKGHEVCDEFFKDQRLVEFMAR
jgi:predicted esterase